MVSFGATVEVFQEFNFYEAVFWILLAAVLFSTQFMVDKVYRAWLFYSSLNLLLFGVTDIIEMYTGGFLHTTQWLLYWKIIHVVGIVLSVAWYLRIRLKNSRFSITPP